MSSFVIAASDGGKLLVDPFLGNGPAEYRRLDAAVYDPGDIEGVDAILVTHAHPDHYEKETIRAAQERGEAKLLSTAEVVEDFAREGGRRDLCRALTSTDTVEVRGFEIRPVPCPDHLSGRYPTSIGFRIRSGDLVLYHAGDTYRPGADHDRVAGADLALLWPWEIELMLCAVRPAAVVLMHFDRFEPGDFTGDIDPEAMRKDLAGWFPETEFLVPEKGVWYPVAKGARA